MDDLRKILVSSGGLFLAVFLQIMVFIKGWGLEPQSWWWIIGVGFFGQVIAQIIVRIGAHGSD